MSFGMVPWRSPRNPELEVPIAELLPERGDLVCRLCGGRGMFITRTKPNAKVQRRYYRCANSECSRWAYRNI